MLLGFRVSIEFGHAEIDHIDGAGRVAGADEKVIWLNITVDQVAFMDALDTCNLCMCNVYG